MKTEQIVRDPRKFVLIFEPGDEVATGLNDFAEEHQILSATIEAIGTFKRCTIGHFDRASKRYRKTEINEEVEVLFLQGNFALFDGTPRLHAHVMVAKPDATVYGGHLLKAIVDPMLEVIVTEAAESLIRRWDEEAHLALVDF